MNELEEAIANFVKDSKLQLSVEFYQRLGNKVDWSKLSRGNQSYDKDFLLLWQAYPNRKTDPKNIAYKKWQKSLDEFNAMDIYIGCINYAKQVDDIAFIKALSTLLHKNKFQSFIGKSSSKALPKHEPVERQSSTKQAMLNSLVLELNSVMDGINIFENYRNVGEVKNERHRSLLKKKAELEDKMRELQGKVS